MVSEEERLGDDGPSLVPRDILLIDKYAHQFNNGERRVGLHNFATVSVNHY